jgi:hypothetical protein
LSHCVGIDWNKSQRATVLPYIADEGIAMFRISVLVRIWMILSVAWIVFVCWTFWQSCSADPRSGGVLFVL